MTPREQELARRGAGKPWAPRSHLPPTPSAAPPRAHSHEPREGEGRTAPLTPRHPQGPFLSPRPPPDFLSFICTGRAPHTPCVCLNTCLFVSLLHPHFLKKCLELEELMSILCPDY